MKQIGYYNGTWGELDEMKIPMNDRVCFFGDGVSDATASRNYKIFALEEHLDRFYSSASLLRIEIGMEREELKKLLCDLTEQMDTGDNFVYWEATRGTGPRGHAFLEDGKPANLWVTIVPKVFCDVYEKIRLITVEDTRFLHCNIKTLNLIPSVMASQKAKEAGCCEAVFHRNGRVTECAHSNVHILKDGVFRTAPTDNLILPGVARHHLIMACERLGIPVSEEPFSLEELFDADEVLTSSASTFCLAAYEIDGKPVGGKDPATLRRLQDEVVREFHEETRAD